MRTKLLQPESSGFILLKAELVGAVLQKLVPSRQMLQLRKVSRLHSDFQNLSQAIAEAIQNISEENLLRHPEGQWSVAEVLEHLLLTYKGSIKGFKRCLEAGKPLASLPDLETTALCGRNSRHRLFSQRPGGAGTDSPPGNAAATSGCADLSSNHCPG
jgi:Protein of unknown function (DUF1569)